MSSPEIYVEWETDTTIITTVFAGELGDVEVEKDIHICEQIDIISLIDNECSTDQVSQIVQHFIEQVPLEDRLAMAAEWIGVDVSDVLNKVNE